MEKSANRETETELIQEFKLGADEVFKLGADAADYMKSWKKAADSSQTKYVYDNDDPWKAWKNARSYKDYNECYRSHQPQVNKETLGVPVT